MRKYKSRNESCIRQVHFFSNIWVKSEKLKHTKASDLTVRHETSYFPCRCWWKPAHWALIAPLAVKARWGPKNGLIPHLWSKDQEGLQNTGNKKIFKKCAQSPLPPSAPLLKNIYIQKHSLIRQQPLSKCGLFRISGTAIFSSNRMIHAANTTETVAV